MFGRLLYKRPVKATRFHDLEADIPKREGTYPRRLTVNLSTDTLDSPEQASATYDKAVGVLAPNAIRFGMKATVDSATSGEGRSGPRPSPSVAAEAVDPRVIIVEGKNEGRLRRALLGLPLTRLSATTHSTVEMLSPRERET